MGTVYHGMSQRCSTVKLRVQVSVTGEKFVLALYGCQGLAMLDEYRYYVYSRNIASKSIGATFTLAALPPTSAAARQHSLQTYLQVQQLSGDGSTTITHSYRFTRCTSETHECHKLQM